MTAIPKESAKPLLEILESIQKITLQILLFSMKIVPFAVFGLIVGMVSKIGLESMAGLGIYMVTVVLGLGIMLSVYVLILKFVAKRPIRSTFSKFRNPQTVSFSTASSMATMPVTLKTAEEDSKNRYKGLKICNSIWNYCEYGWNCVVSSNCCLLFSTTLFN